MKKKVFTRIKTAFTITLFVLSGIILATVLFARLSDKIPRIFGYSFHLVVTDSMTPEINVNDLVIAKKTDTSKIKEGDDIIFVSPDPSLNGKIIIHRVYDITEDGKFLTSGIREGIAPDIYPVSEVQGVFVAKSAFWGSVFVFFSKPETLIFILIIVLLLYVTYRLSIKVIKILREDKADTAGQPESHPVNDDDKDKKHKN